MILNRKIFIYSLIIAWVIPIILPCPSPASSGEELFYQADVFYKKFLEKTEKLKYREYWLECIDKFKAAYSKDPVGTLAPASLYMAGKLFQQLYTRSFKASDKTSAINYFERVIKYFPTSYYSGKAGEELKSLGHTITQKKEVKKSTPEKSPRSVEKSVEKKVRNKICRISKAEYKKASESENLREKDAAPPPRNYTTHPRSRSGDFGVIAQNSMSSAESGQEGRLITITGIRVWSNPSYTRVVVDADDETAYTHKLLEEDLAAHKPQRLYIDFQNSKLGKNIERIITIDDNLLTDARAGQYQPDAVRVVVDIKSFKHYKIFSLRNPFRIIIDVWGKNAGNIIYARRDEPSAEKEYIKKARTTEKPEKETGKTRLKKTERKITANGLAKQLALGVKRIVVDPGHGGHDSGAVGYYKHVLEKDIVLSIGKRLARKIQTELGCEVIMTRTTDRFLALEERTAIANTRSADLFISLHTNAHKSQRAYGIETYFLNLATDEDAILVAARENAVSRKNISELQTILYDLMQNSKINESSRMAAHVQKNLYSHMKIKYSKINDKGVKQAPFYVLLDANMPSILIETSFISNKRECERLVTAAYQDELCNAILKGIRQYIRETNPTALLRLKPGSG